MYEEVQKSLVSNHIYSHKISTTFRSWTRRRAWHLKTLHDILSLSSLREKTHVRIGQSNDVWWEILKKMSEKIAIFHITNYMPTIKLKYPSILNYINNISRGPINQFQYVFNNTDQSELTNGLIGTKWPLWFIMTSIYALTMCSPAISGDWPLMTADDQWLRPENKLKCCFVYG